MRRFILGFVALVAACDGESSTEGGGANTTGTNSNTGGDGGGGGTTSTASSGGGGSGGGSAACVPNEEKSCYSGPFATEGVGLCKAGIQVCDADGAGFGPCTGEVLPGVETCLTPEDDDCDGQVNEEGEGCVCIPGSVKLCYSGPGGTAGVGVCLEGVSTCEADGLGYGACMGEVGPKVEDCATPADEDCDGLTPLCPALWANVYGDMLGGQFVWGLALDSAGNTAIVGEFESVVDLGGGPLTSAGASDIVVAKLDPTGAHLWSKSFGNLAAQSGLGIAVGPAGEVVIVGYLLGSVNFGGGALNTAGGADIFVAKFDADGNHVWSKRFGSATDDQLGLAVAVDSVGDVVITGSFAGTINFGGAALASAGGNDIFLAKYAAATGNHVWSKKFGDAGLDQAGQAITVDAMDNVLLTGRFNGTADFGGGVLTSAGKADLFVAKFDSTGNPVFSARYGDAAFQSGKGIATNAAGNIFVVGEFGGTMDLGGGDLTSKGNLDAFVAAFDPSGAHLHSIAFGGSGNDTLSAVTLSGGSLAVTGHLEGEAKVGNTSLTSAGGRDILAAKIAAADLNVMWARLFGDASFYQSGQGVGLDAVGNVTIGGYFFGEVDFGMGPILSTGGADMFVARLPP